MAAEGRCGVLLNPSEPQVYQSSTFTSIFSNGLEIREVAAGKQIDEVLYCS